METSPGTRLRYLRELLGYKGQQQEFAKKVGLTQQSVSNMERDKTEPAAKSLYKIYAAFPQVNIGWLVSAAGVPLDTICGGRALTPVAPPTGSPAFRPDYSSGPATTATAIELLLREIIDSKQAIIELQAAEIAELRGKPFDSADAAPFPAASMPTPETADWRGVRPREAGFVPSYQEAAELSD